MSNISSPPKPSWTTFGLIYAAEDTTTQANVDITSKLPSGGALAASEAFDEPLTKAQVITIVQPFFTPTLS